MPVPVTIPEELKLSGLDLHNIFVQVWDQMREEPSYRLGQSVFNLLPQELCRLITRTELDFFYWTNNDKVIECLYNNFLRLGEGYEHTA